MNARKWREAENELKEENLMKGELLKDSDRDCSFVLAEINVKLIPKFACHLTTFEDGDRIQFPKRHVLNKRIDDGRLEF
jgi:hypothetical protein